MRITFHDAKRAMTLEQRGLDFADAAGVFERDHFTLVDDRRDYGEVRFRTFGSLGAVAVILIWTARDDARHVISMRKCHEREARIYRASMG